MALVSLKADIVKLYGPDFLLAEDNIVVSVQYQIGIFGFLNLGQGDYTGNMGLKY